MYNKQLDTFFMVAKQGSFSKAAEALYITPSAVIQQINNLEQDLQARLLIRTKRGTKLTRAGEYLFREGREFVGISGSIRRQLHVLAEDMEEEICVGTTLLMKCRVFYELWGDFAKENTGCRVKMINMDGENYRKADMVEGIKDGEWWQEDMDFLELYTVPIGCAVPRGHELASRKILTFEEMTGRTMVTIQKGMSHTLDRLREDAVERGVHMIDADWYNLSLFGMCIVNGYLLQTPLCWKDIHPDLVTIPCKWDYALPYGLHYKKNPSETVKKFLDYVRRAPVSSNGFGSHGQKNCL